MSNGLIKFLYLLIMSTNQVLKVWAYKCPTQKLNFYIYYSCVQIKSEKSGLLNVQLND